MASDFNAQDRLPINTSMLTAAGVVALLGALLLGVAALIGSNVAMAAVREWTNQQDVPPTETAKSLIRLLHNAALAGTTAGAEAWKTEIRQPFRIDARSIPKASGSERSDRELTDSRGTMQRASE